MAEHRLSQTDGPEATMVGCRRPEEEAFAVTQQ
jgi:hypothetical protein